MKESLWKFRFPVEKCQNTTEAKKKKKKKQQQQNMNLDALEKVKGTA